MATRSSRRASRRGPARMVSAGLVAAIGALVGACTFGLGDYTMKDRPDARGGVTVVPPGEDAETPEGAASEKPPPGEELDSGPLQPPAEGGTCTDNAVLACTGPNGADSGTCVGERRCVQGVWSNCKLPLKCPGAWSGPLSGTTCQNLDVKGDSDKWTDSPMVGPPVTLWALSRRTPFELYGLEDSFCFTPKHMGGCYTTTTTAVSVECAGGNLKLSGNDFEAGNRGREICVKNPGGSCSVVDPHAGGGQWQPGGSARCQRWFERAHWRVQAEPRCSW